MPSRENHAETNRKIDLLLHRMDTSWGAQDSSEDLLRRSKLQKKRERDQDREEQKRLQLFQVGIQPEQGDEFLGVVLVKANSERQMEPLQGRDLEAQICCCAGFPVAWSSWARSMACCSWWRLWTLPS